MATKGIHNAEILAIPFQDGGMGIPIFKDSQCKGGCPAHWTRAPQEAQKETGLRKTICWKKKLFLLESKFHPLKNT